MTRSLMLLILIGCRSYAVPTVPPPNLPPDGVIEIKSSNVQVKTGSRDVCDGDTRCHSEDVTREETRSTILINGRSLSYGQLRMSDPDDKGAYANSLAEYKQRAQPCNSARKYKIAGIAAAVVGGVIALIDKAPTALRIGGVAIAGGGVVLIVLGYQKSKGCDAVYKFYLDQNLNHAEELTVADRKKELEEIAARFNATRGK